VLWGALNWAVERPGASGRGLGLLWCGWAVVGLTVVLLREVEVVVQLSRLRGVGVIGLEHFYYICCKKDLSVIKFI
jgi:hypothetical protein